MSQDKLYKQFKAKAEAVSAEVHRKKNGTEALEFIKEVIKESAAENNGSVKVAWAETPSLGQFKSISGCQGEIYFGDDIPANAEQAKIGISEVDVAIAESGTIAQDATDVLDRLVSTLSRIHIAVIPTSKLVENISDYLAKLQGQVPGYTAFITGPSRTADIERVLTIGVHGPERLIVVFVDGGEKSE